MNKRARSQSITVDDLLVAIRLKCMDCSGGQRKCVEQCIVLDCPLRKYRNVKTLFDTETAHAVSC